MFDLRLPTGAFFTLVSVILLAMAFFAPDPGLRSPRPMSIYTAAW